MSNVEIIKKAKQANGVSEQVDTYEGWKRNGKQVQKGQKALFRALIWKPVERKADKEKEEKIEPKMIRVNAYFFGMSQTK